MAKSKGSKPISAFVPVSYTTKTMENGKEVKYQHLVKKISTGKGFGVTIILPEIPEENLVTDKDGIKGVWIQFYINRPKYN